MGIKAEIKKRDLWYVGWVEEVPGAFSQERTVNEVLLSLRESITLVLECRAELGLPEPDKAI